MSPTKKEPAAPQAPQKPDFLKLSVDEQVKLIQDVLEPEVMPALRMDGGGLEIMDIEGADILIRYYGACGGCPISETATLPFIEYTLQEKVDPRIRVKTV